MMILAQVADLVYFFQHIYAFRTDYLKPKQIDGISLEAFNTLEAVVKREMKHLSDNSHDPLFCRSTNLIKTLRDELEIAKCIQSLMFGRFSSMKQNTSSAPTKKKQASNRNEFKAFDLGVSASSVHEDFNSPLHRIKVFNEIKKVLIAMTLQNGMISL
jgi:ferredoxin-NADP reductase